MMLAQLQFNPEISLGNLLSILTMLMCAIGFWFKMREEINLLKLDVQYTKERHVELAAIVASVTQVKLKTDFERFRKTYQGDTPTQALP